MTVYKVLVLVTFITVLLALCQNSYSIFGDGKPEKWIIFFSIIGLIISAWLLLVPISFEEKVMTLSLFFSNAFLFFLFLKKENQKRKEESIESAY